MEKHYSTLTDRENTAICGFSMSGRDNLYIGYKIFYLFWYVSDFSSTLCENFSAHHPGLFKESEFCSQVPSIVTHISCSNKDSVIVTFPKKVIMKY